MMFNFNSDRPNLLSGPERTDEAFSSSRECSCKLMRVVRWERKNKILNYFLGKLDDMRCIKRSLRY